MSYQLVRLSRRKITYKCLNYNLSVTELVTHLATIHEVEAEESRRPDDDKVLSDDLE
jgi:hypothetical protein